MNYRKVLAIVLMSGVLMAGGMSVSAEEVVVKEYHCEVGAVLDLGSVQDISDDCAVLEGKKVKAEEVGSCDIVLEDGSLVKLYISEKKPAETELVTESSSEPVVENQEPETEKKQETEKERSKAIQEETKGTETEATEVLKETEAIETEPLAQKDNAMTEKESETETEGSHVDANSEKESEEVETEALETDEVRTDDVKTDEAETEETVKESEDTEGTEGTSESKSTEVVSESESRENTEGIQEPETSTETERTTESTEAPDYEIIENEEVEVKESVLEEKGSSTVVDNAELVTDTVVGFVSSTKPIKVKNGEVVSLDSDDSSVASVVNNGLIKLNKAGKTKIYVATKGKLLTVDVVVIDVSLDESDVTVGPGESYQIELTGDTQGEKVDYTIVSGEGCSVDGSGLVSMASGITAKVKISIAGKTFYKTIVSQTRHQQLWEAMQPYIEQSLGTPYVFGGDTPGAGMDCSGYVSYVMRNVGLMSGRTTAQGLYNMSIMVSDPQPGDLVFFAGTYDTTDYITHIGIYAGDGCMYHSGKPNQYTAITGYYADHLVGYGTLISE